jgi:hypothetical protein
LCAVSLCTFSNNDSCLHVDSCPSNWYSTDVSSYDCKECPSGRDTGDKEGSSSCSICSSGFEMIPSNNNDTGAYSCDGCPLGTFAQQGADSCTSCFAGFYQDEPESRECKPCPAGRWSSLVTATELAQCQMCTQGKYLSALSSSSEASCVSCQPGKHSNVLGAQQGTVCEECDPGEVSDGGATECTGCESGKVQPFPGMSVCIDCAAGTFGGNGTVCDLCAPGKYRAGDALDTARCEECPKGFAQLTHSQPSCLPCIPGKFQDVNGQTECKLCPGETYSNITKSTFCYDCTAGKSTNTVNGSVSCQNCGGGSFGTPCESCKVGQFRSGSDLDPSVCDRCPSGWFAANESLTACLPCVPGTYAMKEESSRCKDCPQGWFTDATAKSECTRCPLGSLTLKEGSAACQKCQAGRIGNIKGDCVDCRPGKFRAAGGANENSTVCDECPQGWFNEDLGQATCTPCNPGFFADVSGHIQCKKCPRNTYAPVVKTVHCDACRHGRTSEVGQVACSTCATGQRKYAGAGQTNLTNLDNFSCIDCLHGTWASAGDTSCTSCAPGFYQNEEQQASCISCGKGTYSTSIAAVSNRTCISCSPGRYSTANGAGNHDACSACPPGKAGDNVIGAIEPSVCKDCIKGRYALSSQTSCKECELGRRAGKSGASSCVRCTRESCGGVGIGVVCACTNNHIFPPVFLLAACSLFLFLTCTRVAGKYGKTFNECTLCEAGKHREDEDSNLMLCKQCALGKTSIAGASSCDTCDLGKRGNPQTPGLCIQCKDGQYTDARGTLDCKICKHGKIPNNNRTLCEPPPWKLVSDCLHDTEYLDDESENKLKPDGSSAWECNTCPRGALCTEFSSLYGKENKSTRLTPKPGYWQIPPGFKPNVREPFVRCTFPEDCLWNATSNITCHNHTKGLLCSTCKVGYDRTAGYCNKCRNAEVPIRLTLVLVFCALVGVLLVSCRRRIERLHAKYSAAWRDVAIALQIIITFAQISQSLPWMMGDFVFPDLYIKFLNAMGLVNIDFLSLIGIQCVLDMDYRYGVLMAFMVPIVVVVVCWTAFRCGKHFILRRTKHTMTDAERTKLMQTVFDVTDFDESGHLDEIEFEHLVHAVTHQKSLKHHQKTNMVDIIREIMMLAGARKEIVSATETHYLLSRASFMAATSGDKCNKHKDTTRVADNHIYISDIIEEEKAYRWIKLHELATTWLSGCIQLMLMFHAPVSARAFYYFDCHSLGEKSFLRRDYQIECLSSEWYAFLPFAVVLLIGFVFAVPVVLIVVLFYNRHHLHSPALRQKIGFLYARFVPGAEWWEIHEVVRKMLLCGLLVYLPSKTRAATAILICLISIATLNYVRPYKNKYLFLVCEGSFLLTAGKYLTTIFASAIGRDVQQSQDDKTLAYFLIFFDVFIFVGGALTVIFIFCMLKLDIDNLIQTGDIDAQYDEEQELLVKKIRRMSSLR